MVLSLALSGLMLTGFAQEKKEVRSEKAVTSTPMHKHRSGKRHDSLRNKNPEEIAKTRTDRMDQKLSFTDTQRKEIYAFHLKQAQDHQKVIAERKAYREKMKQQRMADHEKMMGLLTPEQQKTWKDSYAESRNMHRKHWKKDRQMRKRDFKKENTTETNVVDVKAT